MINQKFSITGMTCSACSSHVERSVSKLNGIVKVSVNLLTDSMQVQYDEQSCSEKQITEAVEKAGYGVKQDKPQEKPQDSFGKDENQEMKTRLLISGVFLLLLMTVSMHHMIFMWLRIPTSEFLLKLFHGNENALTFTFTQLLLTLPIIYVNRKYYQKGLGSLVQLHPNMDSLIAIGSGAALLYGVVAIYRIGYGLGHGDAGLVSRYAGDLYFESAGMILTLITVGKYLETKSKGKTGEAIGKLMDLSPKTAIRLTEEGLEEEILTTALQVNDMFVIKPGMLIPVDGIVVEGKSSINEAAITGESIPVEKQTGDRVVSATMNKTGRLICRAVRVGEDTTLSQIIHLVEEASSSKAPIAKLADKVAGIFVPIVIGIALLTFTVWMLAGGSFETAMSCAIAVLVISCPCALGLATPVAIMVGTGVGASHGILIKSGDILQMTGKVNTVVLDKTGTITEGIPHVTDVVIFYEGYSRNQILGMSAAIEKPSEHPLADAIVEAAERENAQIPETTDFKAYFGKGVSAVLTDKQVANGQRCLAGNETFFAEQGIMLTNEQRQKVEDLAKEGKTPLLFGCEDTLWAVIAVADTIRDSTHAAVKELQNMNINVVMLTGDNKRTAEAVRSKLNIQSVIAEVLPEEKKEQIRRLKEKGKIVAMVGDGVNDAPALAAADVGIAIGAGTDIAIDSADIVLMKNELTEVITAILLSRSVMKNIKENLFWAFFYNSVGIPLAAGLLYPTFGLRLNPMFGAAAMSLSSLFVVGNALRLRNFKHIQQKGERKVMKKIIIIEGMSCGHCTARVQEALEELAAVEKVEMSLEEKNAKITLKEDISNETLEKAITDAGYEVISIQ